MTAAAEPSFIHAAALALGERGLLLRGPSGAGKSALALALIAQVAARGDFARLVGDDRVGVEARGGRLVARPHPRIAGLIEARGLGLVSIDHEPACVLHAVVDLGRAPTRFPEPAEVTVSLKGIVLPRLCAEGCDAGVVARILAFVQAIRTF